MHRSLGVYVSQVRSLTLDAVKPAWARHLRTVGNTKANALYEALLPADFDKSKVRRSDGRQEFIMEKYVALKYTTPEDKERILTESEWVGVSGWVSVMVLMRGEGEKRDF